jgi:NTP pyrophosphatase (non-canonical NTP hydrolase)/thymidylate kinase
MCHPFIFNLMRRGLEELMFNEYQKNSCGTFKPAVKLTPEQVRLLDWAMGLGGESGEVLDLLKHAIFHKDSTLDKMELAKELGDVLWYVSAIATTCEIDLADIAALNRAKLNHRHGQNYSNVGSATRHEKEQELKDTTVYKCLYSRILNKKDARLTVIVVGPDGSGKTTFTTMLSERSGMKRIKCDYRQPDKPALAKQLLNNELNVIYDRFYYPDEIIYNWVKDIPMEPEYLNELQSVLDLLCLVNPVIIYLDAPLATLIERSKAWADDYITIADLTKIQTAYEEWLIHIKEMGIPVIEIDSSKAQITTKEYDELVERIIHELELLRNMYGTPEIKGGLQDAEKRSGN